MESLLYFLLFGALVFLMMRFGCGAHVAGHGHGRSSSRGAGDGADGEARWVPPEKDVDPVCKMTVKTAAAKSAVHDGRVYYFCSPNCRDEFEASPATYVAGAAAPAQKTEHRHESHR